MLDGARHLAVRRVEVAMGQTVAHPRDVAPRVAGLAVEQLRRDGLDCLADLDEADPDGVEYEAIGKVASCHMAIDGRDGIKNVLQAL